MKWSKIKGYPNYMLSEKGDLYNITTDTMLKGSVTPTGVRYVCLSHNGEHKQVQLAQLVLKVFKPSRTDTKVHAWHNDLELEHCADDNLTRCTRGDRKRMFNEIRGKKRGVYAFNGGGKNKFRAMMKNTEGKLITIGYYRTKFFAEFKYIQAYTKMYGRFPY